MPSPCPCRGCMAAYKQGREDGKATVHDCGQHSAACCSAGYQRGYREGYTAGFNDHARSRAYAEQVYGPYSWTPGSITHNQHGKGENP